MLNDESLTLSTSTAAVVTVFVKLPRPGFVKTRLAAGVGAERAAEFYRACAERTVDVVCRCPGLECTVAYAPAEAEEEIRVWLGGREGNPPLRFTPQLDVPDLGARMRAALNEGLGFSSAAAAEQGRRPRGGAAAAVALVVGSDIPDLRPSDVRAAVDALSEGSPMTMETAKVSGGDKPRPDCVLGPAADGGFWVVGMRRSWSGGGGSETSGSGNASPSLLLLPDTLLEGITWSTPQVFAAAAASVKSCGLKLAPKETLRELADIDTIDDLLAWRSRKREGPNDGDESDSKSSLVSVVDEVLSR